MSSPSRVLKWAWPIAVLGAWSIFAYLLSHESKAPTLFSRWSSSFFALLVAWGTLCGAMTILLAAGPRRFLADRKNALIGMGLGLVGALVAAEVGLRVIDPFGFHYLTEMRRYIQMRQDDPKLVYAQPKSQNVDLDGVPIRFNSLGLRGSEIPVKGDGERRVLFLGDSVVFGWGVEEEATFVQGLARELSQTRQESWTGVNAGVCSYNTEQQEVYLRDRGMRLEPDLVVLVFIDNDVLTYSDQWKEKAAQESRSPIRKLQETLRASYLVQCGRHALKNGLRGVSLEGAERGVQPGDPGWQSNLAALARLKEFCAQAEVPLALFHFRWVASDWSNALLEDARQAVAPTPLTETSAWFEESPLRHWVNSQTDSHPNAKAHQRTAERMRLAIEDQQLLP